MRQLAERLVKRGHTVIVATSVVAERTEKTIRGVVIEEFQLSGNSVKGIQGAEEEKKRYGELRNLEIEYLPLVVGDEHDGHFLMTLLNEAVPEFQELLSQEVVLLKKLEAELPVVLFDFYLHGCCALSIFVSSIFYYIWNYYL